MGGIFSRGKVLRSAEVGHDLAGERVERFDSLCQMRWTWTSETKSTKVGSIAQTRIFSRNGKFRRKEEETHRERRIVVPRRVMQRPPQQCRSVLGLATLLAAERPRRQLDRRARLSLPGHFALEREWRVRDGGIFGVRAGEEPGGDKVLWIRGPLQRSDPQLSRHRGNRRPCPVRKTRSEKRTLCVAPQVPVARVQDDEVWVLDLRPTVVHGELAQQRDGDMLKAFVPAGYERRRARERQGPSF